MKKQRLQLVIFDMAGTTVHDKINGIPLILKSYDTAFRRFGIEVSLNVLNEQRGKDKRIVIQQFGGAQWAPIYDFFVRILLDNVRKVKEIEGTSETFKYLHDSHVKVALSTGFPHDVAKALIDHLEWRKSQLIDFWVCSQMVGTSRPDPAMIHTAMNHFDIKDPLSVMKIDDTAIGIEEGLRAGVNTLGVLTGTQSRERLQIAHPTDIIHSVKDLPTYLRQNDYLLP